mgnify:CR=1 FL=1
MFHLDEYIGMPKAHPASFRRYLEERFASRINLRKAYYVSGEGDIKENIRILTEERRSAEAGGFDDRCCKAKRLYHAFHIKLKRTR